MVPTRATLDDILGDDYADIEAALSAYGKVRWRMGWDEYAAKLNDSLRDAMRVKFAELRRNGMFAPVSHLEKIEVQYLVLPQGSEREPADLCTLCDRPCDRKDRRGVFLTIGGREARKCWEGRAA